MAMARFGNMGCSPRQLLSDWVLNASEPNYFAEKECSAIFTDSGQSAILLAARLWGIGENDEVLVPAYNCGSEISPFIAAGAHVSMYRVDRHAKIDLEDLVRRITPRTQVIVVIHYFGRPMEIQALARICRERKIKLLEDCALSLFSDGIGCIGDAAIFSLRKSLPACDGGVLILRESVNLAVGTIKESSTIFTGRRVSSLVKNWLQSLLWRRGTTSREIAFDSESIGLDSSLSLPDIPASYYCHSDAVTRKPSRFTLGLLKRADRSRIVERRRENYNFLSHLIIGTADAKLLWEDNLPIGLCPLGLPILVKDRRRWHYGLNAAGIAISRWWEGYHQGLDWSGFPEARILKDGLLLLPIHQGLTTHHMEYMSKVIRKLASTK